LTSSLLDILSGTIPSTTESAIKFGRRVLPHLSYIPDLAPTDFHFFGFLRNGLRGQNFCNNKAVINAVKQWTASTDADFLPAWQS